MKVEAIITAAGLGQRLKQRVPKALVPFNGQALFLFSVKVFLKSPKVAGIILTVPAGYEAKFKKQLAKLRIKKVVKIVVGGATRSESVRAGLGALDPDTEMVLIHDAARPFVTTFLIEQTITALKKDTAVIVAVPVKPTIKRVDPDSGYVEATLDRRFLWDVQTPQGFHRSTILAAHASGLDATDDAFLVEQMGERVKVLSGDDRNLKITTPDDIFVAKAYFKK